MVDFIKIGSYIAMYDLWQLFTTRHTSLCKIAELDFYKITYKELDLHTLDLNCPDHHNCIKIYSIK